MEVDVYDAWYHSSRGRWIGATEFALLMRLLPPVMDRQVNLLDVGCGTGYFTRHFSSSGMQACGLDPDEASINYAMKKAAGMEYLQGVAESLPFADNSFDYCSAVTSLCFVARPEKALQEMWRVAQGGVLLGLLNRQSLLYRQKQGRGAYRGARWDTLENIREWIKTLSPVPISMRSATAVFFPGGGMLAQGLERLFPASLPWGSFLAVYIEKTSG